MQNQLDTHFISIGWTVELFWQCYLPTRNGSGLSPETLEQDVAIAFNFIGMYYQRIYKNKEALAYFTKALADAPENQAIMQNLAISAIKNEYFEQGIALFEKMAQIQPQIKQNFCYLFYLGIAYYQKKEYLSAITYLQQALKLQPRNLEVTYYLGEVYTSEKEYWKAIYCYRDALERIEEDAFSKNYDYYYYNNITQNLAGLSDVWNV
ncbi:MAG: Tetratricopeptide repeat [Bacteroidota bacterium]|jgi:tetratricopeptide (TPR) repeat protein